MIQVISITIADSTTDQVQVHGAVLKNVRFSPYVRIRSGGARHGFGRTSWSSRCDVWTDEMYGAQGSSRAHILVRIDARCPFRPATHELLIIRGPARRMSDT